ncbi:MAG: DUF3124 domain-containing protein [Deltaproteobacteria bacterium]|nr:DUF3124 domain-containing protein [Deltaproteobacteria bacterium]
MRTSAKGATALTLLPLLLCAVGIPPAPARAETPAHSRGQVVYVPAYSHVYRGDREHRFFLTVTLSVRSTDPTLPLRIVDVEYRGSDGKPLRKFLKTSTSLGPFASTRYIVPESDVSGGSGASFLVTWQSDRPVSPPLVDSVMIGTQGQQGVSFTSRGQVIKELSE